MGLDKLDIEILYILYSQEAFTDISSLDIKKIAETTEINTSYFTILRRVNKKLKPNEYVLEGYKIGNTRTFYLSNKGIDYLKTNILCKEDIYEYIEEDEGEIENE
ncbi:hypothetical protein [Paraclostridium bifermentans]|uniref:Uncharacterized protein n=1 Tax=Romboutsia timonensis TaxID=1776391 RepID=A0A921MZY8_9FIRM|nr:hypothetical protein [Paraclostridium bifermentans]HJG95824.1 hypothetical protein [Romboutsia timonensis]